MTIAPLLIVDDDPALTAAISRAARIAGLPLVVALGTRAAAEALDRHEPSAVVVDLLMPRSDGRGFMGGLEVLRRAGMKGVAGRVWIALEEPHDDAELLALDLGAAGFVNKPRGNDALSVVRYLNRLSDHLFVLGRALNDNGAADVMWLPGANR